MSLTKKDLDTLYKMMIQVFNDGFEQLVAPAIEYAKQDIKNEFNPKFDEVKNEIHEIRVELHRSLLKIEKIPAIAHQITK